MVALICLDQFNIIRLTTQAFSADKNLRAKKQIFLLQFCLRVSITFYIKRVILVGDIQ